MNTFWMVWGKNTGSIYVSEKGDQQFPTLTAARSRAEELAKTGNGDMFVCEAVERVSVDVSRVKIVETEVEDTPKEQQSD